MTRRPHSFSEFWPHYLLAHRNLNCRRLHYAGTTGAFVGLILSALRLDPRWGLAGLAFAYAMAWLGHFAVERNRPATFGNPLWSLMGDVRMYLLWISGKLGPILRAAEIREPKQN